MNSFKFPTKVVISGVFAAAFALTNVAYAAHRCEDYGLKKLGMHVVPVEGESAIAVEEFVAEVRDNKRESAFVNSLLGGERSLSEIAGLLVELHNDPVNFNTDAIPAALTGVEGLVNRMLLNRILNFNGEPIAEQVLYGKIRDYIFVEKTGQGHLSVDTCLDDLKSGRRELYHWDIEILPGGFSVIPRQGDETETDPFPGAGVTLPDAALDPTNPNSIWARHLDHKLGARGQSIEVRSIYYRDLSTDDLQLLPNPGNSLYNSTENSCIDLFTVGFPPSTFGELAGNDYCLGRCKHPAVYNSGD